MTRRCVTDEQWTTAKTADELVRRTDEGTLDYDWVMAELQRTVEGRRPSKLNR